MRLKKWRKIMEKEKDIKTMLDELDNILFKMKDNKTSLDENITLYEKGEIIVKKLEKQLSDIENKVSKVIEIDK